MHVSGLEWAVLAGVVAVASTMQGVVGFGSNLLAVPVVALIVPTALPAALVVPNLPMVGAMAVHERRHIDWRGSSFLLLGRIPGTALGVSVVAAVSPRVLAMVIGTIVVLAVAASMTARHLHPGVTRKSVTIAGATAGIASGAAAIGVLPLALLYQNEPASVFRSTLAAQSVFGALLTLTGLGIAGELHGWQLLLGVSFMPCYFAGLALSLAIRARLAGRDLRAGVLTIVALAGVAAIIRGFIAT